MSHDKAALDALFQEIIDLAGWEVRHRATIAGASEDDATREMVATAGAWRDRFERLTCPNHHQGATGTASHTEYVPASSISHHHTPPNSHTHPFSSGGSTCNHA